MDMLCSLVLVVLLSVMFSSFRFSQGLLDSAAGSPNSSSYGTEFWIPFPGIAVSGMTSFFQYRVCVTNPNTFPITITTSAVRHITVLSKTISVSTGATRFITFGNGYRVKGEGTFRKYVRLTSSNNFAVYVMTTEKMDAFTALPVASWGNNYMAVTYCGQSDGPCQIVVIAHTFTEVVIRLPVQENTKSSALRVSKRLSPGDVYQLQRNFDLTGAIISSNESVGVLTGSANSTIVKGWSAGAFMEFLPPIAAMGSSFVVYKTPPWSSSSDFIRVVALNNGTNVYISTGYQRFQLQGSQYVTRQFFHNVLLVEADQPVLVVKYSQNEEYPTMTLIPPTALYLTGETVIISEVPRLTNKQQFLVVVATTDFMQQMNLGSAVQLTGTNMAAIVLRVSEGSGNLTLVGPKDPKMSFMVYSYLISDTVSFQTAVAFNPLTINQPCSLTRGSPGDQIDNDCDGEIDEDICNENNYMSFSDCGAIVSDDPDIWGKDFILQVADHCQSSLTDDIVLLYVTARSDATAVQVALETPTDASKVKKSLTLARTDNYRIFNLTGAAIKGNGSKLVSDQTLHMTSSAEVSVTLFQVCTLIGSESIMATRLIPCDVLGREYFAITVCNVDLCQIQIAAFHQGITQVRIRLRLQDGATPFMFNSVEYKDGEVISVSLLQYQSLQLQSNERDLTGTHILANKPVAVFSGGRYTMFKKMHMSNGFVEQLPPVETWGRYFIVQSSPVTKTMNKCSSRLCLDYLKIVASTADTVVYINQLPYTLTAAGDFIEVPLPAVYSTVESTKPILVLQLTQEVNTIALSGSIVTARDHYVSAERLAVPVVDSVKMYLMIGTDHINAREDGLKVNNTTVTLTTNLNASFYESSIVGEDFLNISLKYNFSGHVYSSGNLMAGLFRLAYALTKINSVCVVSKDVPGDNKDNDCDGQIDEEPCLPSEMAADLDWDGMANEDCSSPPVSSSLSASSDPPPTELIAVSTFLPHLETPYATTVGGYTKVSLLETWYVTTAEDGVKESSVSGVFTHITSPYSFITPAFGLATSLLDTSRISSSSLALTSAVAEQTLTSAVAEQTLTSAVAEQTLTSAVAEQTLTSAVAEQTLTNAVAEQTLTSAVAEQILTSAVAELAFTSIAAELALASTMVKPALTSTEAELALTSTVAELEFTSTMTELALTSTVAELVLRSSVAKLALTSSVAELVLTSSVAELVLTSSVTELVLTSSLAELELTSSVAELELTSSVAELAFTSTVAELAFTSTVAELAFTSTVAELAFTSTVAELVLTSSVAELVLTSSVAELELTSSVAELAFTSTVAELALTSTVAELAFTSTVAELAFTSTVAELAFTSTEMELALTSTEMELALTSTEMELALTSTEMKLALTSTEMELALSSTVAELAWTSTEIKLALTSTEIELALTSTVMELALTSTVAELPVLSATTTFDAESSCLFSEHPWGTTKITPGLAISPSAMTNGIACGCHCPKSVYTSVLDSNQVAQLTLAIQKELSINKNDVSANRRKYISIEDYRPSAQTVGYFGVGIIIATFLGICLLDAGALTRDIAGLIQLCRVKK